MRRFLAFSTLLSLLGCLALPINPGMAQDQLLPPELSPPSLEDLPAPPENDAITDPAPALEPEQSAEKELDKLFAELQATTDDKAAQGIATKIQLIWLRSGSPTIDLLMARSAAAMEAKNYGLALDLLDTVTVLAPDYAEGWNRRATIFYLQEDFGRSLIDIEKTLSLEPRHWGAISGFAIIMRRLERPSDALQAFKRVLELNPNSPNARKAVEDLEKETAGQPI
ncbi:tetratricopeptide repeat protein [Stappia sp. F7233]|uniref:Tetratricopeptide repeat protein n=1 Tax=Stappia albiluteola TaxID=2758565 RepID=A0A839AEJ2_9HYPH|nr:tetratricopeptide repeat protein [Stappia albiluteola]MBA5777322.1 tetratricopeptide repeat protein [Stappia albiluteola]